MLSSENPRTILPPGGGDRRSCPRERVLLSALELTDNNGGIVLNISEHGLAMRVVNRLRDDEFAHVRFQVAQTTDWIETRVRVAWIDDPRTTVGVQFVELSQQERKALDGWISSLRELDGNGVQSGTGQARDESAQAAARVEEDLSTAIEEISARADTDDNQAANSSQVENKTVEIPRIQSSAVGIGTGKGNGSARPRLSIAESLGVLEASPDEFAITAERRGRRRGTDRKWTALIVVLAILILAVEGFYGWSHFRRFANSASNANQNAVASAPPAPVTAKPSAPVAPAAATGFVVQAGAMAHREDAVELADSLQQKGFPSFIFKRDTARLYEVVIGPYSTAEEAQKIRNTLQAQGTDTFVRSWPFQ